MPRSEMLITKDDLIKCKFEDIISSCDEKACFKYSRKFFEKARQEESAGIRENIEVLNLLGNITSMYLRPDSATDPLKPFFVTSDSRSAILEDFNDNQLEVLGFIVSDIKDAELRARIADVLWIRSRQINFAQLAIESYLESADILEHPQNWNQCADRIERAFRLSILIGSKAGYIDKVVQHIENILDKYKGEDPLFLSKKLMGFLLEIRRGDYKKYSELSKTIANHSESEGNFYRARAYWEMEAQWHKLNEDSQNEKKAKINAAGTYVKEAENSVSKTPPNFLGATFHMQKAIEAYRRIGGQQDRVEELHLILLQYQQKSIAEMKTISAKVDLTDLVKDTVEKIKGKSLRDALFEFAIMIKSPRVKELREEVTKSAKEHPIQHLVTAVVVNEHGKVVGKKSGMFSNDKDEVEASIRENMFKHAEFHHVIDTQGIIEPIRYQLNLEHNIRINDFYEIVSNNPFVPEGRELIFAQGLLEGMQGDFLSAAHLLIPQIENSIRHILSQLGEITSGIDSEGIQDERSLNTTLYHQKILELFGEDLVFDLQCLLVERLGANLRNRMAHGLMSYDSFYSIHIPYLWALVLRLCCLPLIMQKLEKEKQYKHGN